MPTDLDRFSLDTAPRWMPLIVGFGDLLAVGAALMLICAVGGLVCYLFVALMMAALGYPA